MKNVFLFPGQGAQKKGMLFDICNKYEVAKQTVLQAEKITGEPISRYMWEIEDIELARSDRSQLAITTTSIALLNVLKSKGVEPDICAGFSLGEFTALYAAGVLSFEDVMKLICMRGKIMQKTCDLIAQSSEGKNPGMAAVIGLEPENLAKIIEPLEKQGIAFCANYNSKKQTVVSGTFDGLNKAEELCVAAGCRRFIKLKVAGPFHSPLMKQAGIEFEQVLKSVQFNNPAKKLFSNVTGKSIESGEEAKKLAIQHFTNPVKWTSEEAEIANLISASDINCRENWRIFEVGPGSVLCGLWRDSDYSENINCKSVNTEESLEEI